MPESNKKITGQKGNANLVAIAIQDMIACNCLHIVSLCGCCSYFFHYQFCLNSKLSF
jgi:hypothetical protein